MSESPVIQLLDLTYENAMKPNPRSWQRINYAMRQALEIAIGSLFEFAIGDFSYIMRHYNASYWCGEDTERWYSACVADGNQSAIASFEAYKDRGPIIADNVTPVESRYAHVTGVRAKERLHVGAQFMWKGHRVTVTSFNPNGSCTACAYNKYDPSPDPTRKVKQAINVVREAGWSVNWYSHASNKPIRRFTISRDDIIADRAETKRRNEIESEIVTNGTKEQIRQFMTMLGSPDVEAYSKLPLKKLESALRKCLPATETE